MKVNAIEGRDAETQIMPVMYVPISWDEIKTTIQSQVNQYSNNNTPM
jgi:hypothetical protein